MQHTEMQYNGRKRIAVCETQPMTVEGLRSLLSATDDLDLTAATDSLAGASEVVRNRRADVIVVDKSIGIQAVLDWLANFRTGPNSSTEVVVWGVSVTEAEALRFLQSGAKGILRKAADAASVLSCLRAVASGASWMSDVVFREAARYERNSKSELTPREQQVMELVEQGLKNKEIARELGIRPGTVKIHLKHIFEKTGVRGRYGLALSVMRQKTGMSSGHDLDIRLELPLSA